MKTLRLVMGDHLSHNVAALRDFNPRNDIILMVEVASAIEPVAHHKQKIVLVLSAMRHFAEELRQRGLPVDYVSLEDAGNTQSFTGEVRRAVARHGAARLIVTAPSEWQVAQELETWQSLGFALKVLEDDRFLCSRDEFSDWARGRGTLRMEYFYRQMGQKTQLLMEGGAPAGGSWNFDKDNRKRLPSAVTASAGGGYLRPMSLRGRSWRWWHAAFPITLEHWTGSAGRSPESRPCLRWTPS